MLVLPFQEKLTASYWKMKTKRLVLISLFTALLAVIAPLSIQIGQIPISLASFMIMLTSFILGKKDSVIVVFIYILLAIIGLPVLASYKSGISSLFGMTGGYIFGYISLAYFSSYFGNDTFYKKILGMLLGTILLYTIGTIWFIIYTKTELWPSLLICVVPFIPGDIIKIVVVALFEKRFRNINKSSTSNINK